MQKNPRLLYIIIFYKKYYMYMFVTTAYGLRSCIQYLFTGILSFYVFPFVIFTCYEFVWFISHSLFRCCWQNTLIISFYPIHMFKHQTREVHLSAWPTGYPVLSITPNQGKACETTPEEWICVCWHKLGLLGKTGQNHHHGKLPVHLSDPHSGHIRTSQSQMQTDGHRLWCLLLTPPLTRKYKHMSNVVTHGSNLGKPRWSISSCLQQQTFRWSSSSCGCSKVFVIAFEVDWAMFGAPSSSSLLLFRWVDMLLLLLLLVDIWFRLEYAFNLK